MKQSIKNFFSRQGWLVCIILVVILATGILVTLFDTWKVVLYLLAIPVIAILGYLFYRYRRYFNSIMLVLILVGLIVVAFLVLRNGNAIKQNVPTTPQTVTEQPTVDKSTTPVPVATPTEPAKTDSTTKKPAAPKVAPVNTSKPSNSTPSTTTAPATTPASTPATTPATTPTTTPATPPTTPTPEPVKITVKIAWGDYTKGATEIFASVILSDVPKASPVFESNLECKVQKISDKVYYVRITVAEGSHGTAALEVSGDGIEKIEKSLAY